MAKQIVIERRRTYAVVYLDYPFRFWKVPLEDVPELKKDAERRGLRVVVREVK